ncbi:N-ethylmaleimide reductase [Nocardioides ganghwensis]|jgi:N-ethylmaleimide reductase|uniref:N-ethylmaleimide reductase n=1 Tax=Nocardioides ganghwensis TaxID=252230 RepID=A0A4Q2S8E6_9ACTN|nr:N-ethylmaleimide reductase [Nocardioides ganghwensis]MBD3945635.1 N-ethylmaleimide reductase [Nocardioides ganghwensis]RYB99667.1 N-ethylmaleimide reductase [Nocardioides ganghwensis]
MPSLFEPLSLGAVRTQNRAFMAPLTRMRATVPGDVPNDLMREYYVQRASAGLLISEGTQVSPEGKGYMDTPGIHSDEQVAGWRRVTDAVHEAGGLIAAQLWHVGRVSHESFHDGALPVSASAGPYRNRTTVRGEDGRPTRVACPVPRALDLEEIPRVVEDYRRATVNAREAGFDLVEIHGAHGYLLHQFLAADSNLRTDPYGGPLANRARLVLEVTDAVVGAWSADRVAVRISPIGSFNGTEDPEGAEAGLYVAGELARRGLAFLHLSEPDWAGGPELDDDYRRALRAAHPGPIVGAGNYDLAKAERLLDAGWIDAAAFGRSFIANPDLPRRLAEGLPLNPPRPESFYGGDAEGYTDYPAHGAA